MKKESFWDLILTVATAILEALVGHRAAQSDDVSEQ